VLVLATLVGSAKNFTVSLVIALVVINLNILLPPVRSHLNDSPLVTLIPAGTVETLGDFVFVVATRQVLDLLVDGATW
jgi:hypothetical protein